MSRVDECLVNDLENLKNKYKDFYFVAFKKDMSIYELVERLKRKSQ